MPVIHGKAMWAYFISVIEVHLCCCGQAPLFPFSTFVVYVFDALWVHCVLYSIVLAITSSFMMPYIVLCILNAIILYCCIVICLLICSAHLCLQFLWSSALQSTMCAQCVGDLALLQSLWKSWRTIILISQSMWLPGMEQLWVCEWPEIVCCAGDFL